MGWEWERRIDTYLPSKWYFECKYWRWDLWRPRISWWRRSEYFDLNYECYCLEPKYDGTLENHVYNLNMYSISFKEVGRSIEGERIFVIKKKKKKNFPVSIYYLADITGFVLLSWKVLKLRVYYYDFEQKFSSQIKTRIPDNIDGEIKLSSRSIWIATRKENVYCNKCLIDVTNIKNERLVSCYSCFPTCFRKENASLNYITDGDECSIFSSSCKALYINHDNLIL